MIARTWRGAASGGNAAAYQQHFEDSVAPALQALPGQRGAFLLRREVGGRTEFLAVTLWDSRDAIRAFAGPDIAKAHVEPEARAVLAQFDETADHYEVVVSPGSAQRPRRIEVPA